MQNDRVSNRLQIDIEIHNTEFFMGCNLCVVFNAETTKTEVHPGGFKFFLPPPLGYAHERNFTDHY